MAQMPSVFFPQEPTERRWEWLSSQTASESRNLLISWVDAYHLFFAGHVLKLDRTRNFGEDRIVTANPNIFYPDEMLCHADERESLRLLPPARRTFLTPKRFAYTISSVSCTALPFL